MGARVVESGPGGDDLAADAWQRAGGASRPSVVAMADLPAVLPDRGRGLRVHRGGERPVHRGRAVDQLGQPASQPASQQGPAQLCAPWDPLACRYRVPDEKTIRVVLDRLDPRALTGALLGPVGTGSLARWATARLASAATVRGSRPAGGMLARGRLRAVAVDGKTSRGAHRADGSRVHLLGVAEHGGRLLDHLEVGVKHNETSHFTELLASIPGHGQRHGDLRRPPYVRANLEWLIKNKKATTWRSLSSSMLHITPPTQLATSASR